MRILGVSGSLRADSQNTRLLAAASWLLPDDVEYVRFEALKAIPPFDEDDEEDPGAAVEQWREAVAAADGLLFATPEYNGSIPGQLKNAIDWASRPFEDAVIRSKNAAVIGASHGMFGGVWAQAELRKVLSTAGARVLDRDLPVSYAAEAFDADGRLVDRELEHRLEEIVGELVEQCRLSLQLAAAR
jgi:chromate reductase